MSRTQIKICGIVSPDVWQHCVAQGVDYLGLMFYPNSPRNITITEAKALNALPRRKTQSVAVCVDASDAILAEIAREVKPDYWQFHGKETPERLQEIRAAFGKPIIKSFPIAGREDFAQTAAYTDCADMFLFDAKPRPDDILPGGNAHSFNWSLLPAQQSTRPWFLAGGLTPDNAAEAVRLSQASAVDVSSGVEQVRGVKRITKIDALLRAL